MKKLPHNEENNEVAVDEDSNDWRQLVEEAGAQGDYLAVEVEKYPLDRWHVYQNIRTLYKTLKCICWTAPFTLAIMNLTK